MGLYVTAGELELLHRDLNEDPDVAPDDRVRALAAVGFWKVLTLAVAVVAFPFGFFLAAALMMWIDGGSGVAVLCGFLASLLAMALPATSYLLGRSLQVRQIRRSLRHAADRRQHLVATSSVGGGTSPVAIASSRRR